MLAPDKIAHLKGGLLLFVACAILTLVLLRLGAHPLAAALLVAGLAAGAAIEGVQYIGNRNAKRQGLPPPNDVSLPDLVASAAACWIGAVVVQLLHHLGRLPLLAS